jgi:hypothetical protein
MAVLLTTGAFARVTFASPTSGAWQALAPVPGFSTGTTLATAVSTGGQLDIYVIDSGAGQFAYAGGIAYGYDDSIVSPATMGTTATVTPTGGSPEVWCKIASTIYRFNPTGLLELMPAGDMTALKVFLP